LADFVGTAGNDTINGTNGNDRIEDRLGGNDVMRGGDGDDWLQVWRQNTVNFSTVQLDGGAGSDRLWVSWFSGAGIDVTMDGGDGDDAFHVFFSQSSFVSSNQVEIIGGAGDDTVYLNHHSDVLITLGAGQDRIEFNDFNGSSIHSGQLEFVRITDFETGATGDILAMETMLFRVLDG
jgi:Ca2+-binding RTX toxin-like protein